MSTTLTISACHRLPTAPPTPCATLRAPHIWHATTAQTPIPTANRPIFVNSINMQRPPPARHAFGTPMERADPVSGTNPTNPHVGLVWIPSLRGAKSVTGMPTASLMTMEVGYAPAGGGCRRSRLGVVENPATSSIWSLFCGRHLPQPGTCYAVCAADWRAAARAWPNR